MTADFKPGGALDRLDDLLVELAEAEPDDQPLDAEDVDQVAAQARGKAVRR